MRERFLHAVVWTVILVSVQAGFAQKGGGSGQQGSGAGAGGGGGQSGGTSASLPGINYTQHDWPDLLKSPPVNKSRVVVCYKLKYTNSAAQPFVLEPLKPGKDGRPSMQISCDATGKKAKDIPDREEREQCSKFQDGDPNPIWNACSAVDINHPLQMRDLLVVGIDASDINFDDRRLRLLNLNVTNQQGNPINATPVRPSFSGAASTTSNAGAADKYFLTWPYELPGDVIPTLSVNTVTAVRL